MSRGNSAANDREVYKLPTDITDEVIDTPDILAARAFDPRKEFDILNRSIGARLENEKQAAYDDYGAYSGIPSAVGRNRLRDMRIGEANTGASLAMAEGATAASELEGQKLMGMAELTKKRRQSGFTSTIKGAQSGGGIASSLIGAGGSIAGAAIMA